MPKKYEHSHLTSRAKTGRGRREIDARQPKVLENPKRLLALRGHATSAVGTGVLDELAAMKKPRVRKLQRKNDVLPFESGGETHLEHLAALSDCSLFALVNHTKKRPHNLVLGRTFSGRILDMLEFAISDYRPAMSVAPNVLKSAPGSAPLLLFNGDDFEATDETRTLRSLMLDMFRGPHDVTMLDLAGVDRAIVLTLVGTQRVEFRQYAVQLRKDTESSLPKVALVDAGPHFDLTLRRSQLAPAAFMLDAMKKPRDPRRVRKIKNVSRDDMGDRKGRIHVGKQDLSSLALARMKGLGKKRKFESGAQQQQQQDQPDAAAEKPATSSPKRVKFDV